jgi:hypothetical protein
MTNGLVEIALISVSVILGLSGLPFWSVAVMVGVSGVWWGFVHHRRIADMVRTVPTRAFGSLLLALLVVAIGHTLSFVLGGAFHTILGFK